MKLESLSSQSTGLPKSFYRFFWDYPPVDLSWETDKDLIIRRILTKGSWEAVVWLRKQMGDEMLRQWLVNHHCKGLSARQIRFWELLLGLPKKQTNDWIQIVRSIPWG
jgi:hypothetical protein